MSKRGVVPEYNLIEQLLLAYNVRIALLKKCPKSNFSRELKINDNVQLNRRLCKNPKKGCNCHH